MEKEMEKLCTEISLEKRKLLDSIFDRAQRKRVLFEIDMEVFF